MGRRYTVGGRDEDVANFVLSMNPMMELGEYPYTAIGQVNEQGIIIGGCVITNYTKRDCHGHLAGQGNWLTRRFLGECFRHIFIKLGCVRCTGIVAESNLRAQRFDEGLGFIHEGTLRRFLPNGEDAMIYGMLREECRWLNVGVLDGTKRNPASRIGPTVAALQRSTGPEQRTRITAHLGPRGHG
jgi:hypothetical protein